MAPDNNSKDHEKSLRNLEEICENTRAIRRVVNRIFDHLHEYSIVDDDYKSEKNYDPDTISWEDLDNGDDMYM